MPTQIITAIGEAVLACTNFGPSSGTVSRPTRPASQRTVACPPLGANLPRNTKEIEMARCMYHDNWKKRAVDESQQTTDNSGGIFANDSRVDTLVEEYENYWIRLAGGGLDYEEPVEPEIKPLPFLTLEETIILQMEANAAVEAEIKAGRESRGFYFTSDTLDMIRCNLDWIIELRPTDLTEHQLRYAANLAEDLTYCRAENGIIEIVLSPDELATLAYLPAGTKTAMDMMDEIMPTEDGRGWRWRYEE